MFYTKLRNNNIAKGCYSKEIHRNMDFSKLIPISKEIIERHRNGIKQQWTGKKWIDYVEPDDVQKIKLIKKLTKKYKRDKEIKIRNLTIIINNNLEIQMDNESRNKILMKIILLNNNDEIEWIDKSNKIFKIKISELKKALKEADNISSNLVLECRNKINDLKNKTLQELKEYL